MMFVCQREKHCKDLSGDEGSFYIFESAGAEFIPLSSRLVSNQVALNARPNLLICSDPSLP